MVARYIDLSPFWTDPNNPTIADAMRETGLDRRTLSAARKGHLDRSQYETLFTLRDFASTLAGHTLTLEELFAAPSGQD